MIKIYYSNNRVADHDELQCNAKNYSYVELEFLLTSKYEVVF